MEAAQPLGAGLQPVFLFFCFFFLRGIPAQLLAKTGSQSKEQKSPAGSLLPTGVEARPSGLPLSGGLRRRDG